MGDVDDLVKRVATDFGYVLPDAVADEDQVDWLARLDPSLASIVWQEISEQVPA
jgi:hypothetical protein